MPSPAMERVQELQKLLQKVEPPRKLMGEMRKWVKERKEGNSEDGTTGYGGMRIDFR